MNFLSNWHLYLGGAVGLFGVASYFLGLSSVLRIFASILEIITPALRGIVEALIEWIKIMWEGFKDIVDSWKTFATVVSLCVVAYMSAKIPAKIEQHKCKTETQQLKKQVPPKKKTPEVQYKWFWEE